MGFAASIAEASHPRTRKLFLLTNYVLLGAASACIFLTLSLRLLPSLIGFLFILLHLITIAGAVSGSIAASHSTSSGKFYYYGAHMVATVLTAIFQGSVSILIFTATADFLARLNSYVQEDSAEKILKLAGGLCAAIFCLEWVVLTLAFFLNYYAYAERSDGRRVRDEEDLKSWPVVFQA